MDKDKTRENGYRLEKKKEIPIRCAADFGLFRDLLGRITWNAVLETGSILESWLIFKDQSPSLSSRLVHSHVKQRWQRACMAEQGATLKTPKETFKKWKQGQMTQEAHEAIYL